MNVRQDGRMTGWMDGWMDGWTAGWMDGMDDRLVSWLTVCLPSCVDAGATASRVRGATGAGDDTTRQRARGCGDGGPTRSATPARSGTWRDEGDQEGRHVRRQRRSRGSDPERAEHVMRDSGEDRPTKECTRNPIFSPSHSSHGILRTSVNK